MEVSGTGPVAPAKRRDEDDGEVLSFGATKGYELADFQSDELNQGMWDAEIKAFMDTYTLKGLFYHEDWVYILVDMVADHVAMSPLLVHERKLVGKRQYVNTIGGHELNALFEEPNEFQEYYPWMYNYTVENCLMGNTIQWRSKRLDQMYILPTETVLLKFAGTGRIEAYQVNTANGFAAENIQDGMEFKPSEIWHQRRPNPSSLVWGLSPFIPNRKSVLFNRYTQDYLNSFYLKGATPGLVLKMEKNVSEDSAMRFLRSFEVAHTGRRNMRRTIMLPKGVGIETITPNIGDQKLVEMINSNREKILNILRVPKHALSLAENGSLGSEEHKVALKFFYTSAIIPIQKKIAAFLTRQFRKERRLKENEFLAFDNSGVEALKEDELKRAQLGQALREQWTLNEIRQEIHDMEPIEGGDAYPGSTGNSTQPNIPNSGTVIAPDVEEDGEEEEPEQAEEEDDEEEEEDDTAKGLRVARIKIIHDKFGDAIAASSQGMEAAIDGNDGEVTAIWLAAYASMAAKAVGIVKNELNKMPAKEKADDDVPTRRPKRAKLKAKLDDEFSKDAAAVGERHTEQLIGTLEDGYTLGLNTIFDGPTRDEVEVLRLRDAAGRRQLLMARGLKTFSGVSSEATEAILDIIANGVKKQKTVKGIAGEIVARFAELGRSKAETIARTEILTAVSIGKAAAMQNAGEVIDDLVKVWITAGDLRVRGTPGGTQKSRGNHFKLQGDVVPANEPFDNGLFYPRDPKSKKPHEVINCRCDFLVVSARDLGQLNIPKN
jgi:HK97 family phage portal protein